MGKQTEYAPSYLAPDHNKSAMDEQYKSDQQAWQQTAKANRPEATVNPFSNQQWHQDANGNWSQNSTLVGGAGDASRSLANQYASLTSQPMDTGQQARDQAVNAAYGQATSRLDPQWDKRQEAQRTQLLNQGLDPGSEAYKSAMQDFGLQRNDAYTSAMNSAIGQGTAAGNQIFQNNLAGRDDLLAQLQGLQGMAMKTPNEMPLGNAPSQQWMNAFIADNNAAMQKATNTQQQQSDAINGIGQAAAIVAAS